MVDLWIKLLICSFAIAFVAVFAFKQSSSPIEMQRNRDRLIARIIELFLYQESLRNLCRAFARVVVSAGKYLQTLVFPVFVAIVFVLPVLLLSEPILSKRSVEPGEEFLVEAWFEDFNHADLKRVEIVGVYCTKRVDIPRKKKIVWQVKIAEAGKYEFHLQELKGKKREYEPFCLSVGKRPFWVTHTWDIDRLSALSPGVELMEKTSNAMRVRIDYPDAKYPFSNSIYRGFLQSLYFHCCSPFLLQSCCKSGSDWF